MISRLRWLLCAAVCLAACVPVTSAPPATSIPSSATPPPAATPVPAASVQPVVGATYEPGLTITGRVTLSDGVGLPGVRLLRAYASYAGQVVALSDSTGVFHSDFAAIPGDEMVSVWPEMEGYGFQPAPDMLLTWDFTRGGFFWRHYTGYEAVVLNFIAVPTAQK